MDIEVLRSSDLSEAQRAAVHALFDANYREANHGYLDKSLGVLDYVALAESEGRLMGFAVGDAVRAELPRIEEPQAIARAGLSCIDPECRRQGLFTRLSLGAITENGIIDPGKRFLFTGRMAHVITYRHMANNANNAVPAPNAQLTDWHREVGVRIAELFQCKIDPETFVVRGPGQPIGYPRVDYDVPAPYVDLFAEVNRDRGDSLLAMSWISSAPPGWLDTDG